MESITDFIKFLKSRQSFHSRKAKYLAVKNPDAAKKHMHTAASHGEIIKWFEESPNESIAQKETNDEDLFSLNPLDLQDLPDDFVTELNVTESDRQDAQLIELLKIAGRPLELTEFLIAAYRRFDVRLKRTALSARLYRMAKRNMVHHTKQGVYALGPAPNIEKVKNSDANGEKHVPKAEVAARVVIGDTE